LISETAPPSGAAAEAAEQARVDAIVAAGPVGALALAGIAVALVLAMWFAFYFIVFLPRT
jgi:hypothetical protein